MENNETSIEFKTIILKFKTESDLKLYEQIQKAASEDERSVSQYVLRLIREITI
jgi:hypothetical protein